MLFKINLAEKSLISVLIVFTITTFVIAGCKGKEEKTVGPALEQSAEKQEKSGGPGTQGPGLSEQTPSGQTESTGNTPPRITSFDVTPQNPVIGDTIKATVVTSDKDGDSVTVSYQWSRNNDMMLSYTSDALTLTNDFKRGDKISLRVIPDDSKTKGTPLTMNISVANAPPVINPSQETFSFNGNIYTYQINASDADGDPLSYGLKSAPSGMNINPSTGLIKWNVPPSFKGKAPITVSVSDGHGSEILQSFTLEITPEKK